MSPQVMLRNTFDSAFEEEKCQLRCVEHRIPTTVATLDLSKFPAKCNPGSTSGSSRKSSRVTKNSDLGLGKTKKSSSPKGSSPQRVRAYVPTSTSPPSKLTGSMAFAQKAQALDESYAAWMEQGQKQLIRGSSGKGRLGRLTAIEQEVLATVDPSWLKQLSRQSATISEILEDEEWTMDPNNLTSLDLDTGQRDSSCDPPAFSTYDEDTQSRLSDKTAYFEPPCPSPDALDEACPMNQEVFICGDSSMDNCINATSLYSDNADYLENYEVPITRPPQGSKTKGADKRELDTRSSTLCLQPNSMGKDSLMEHPDAPAKLEQAYNLQKEAPCENLPVDKARQWVHDAFGATDPAPCPSPQIIPVRAASMSHVSTYDTSKRISINLNSINYGTSGSHFEPSPYCTDIGSITYREAEQPAQRRRHSLGFAKRILGVTLGMASSAAMVVSGVMIARLTSRDSHKYDEDEAPEPYPDSDEVSSVCTCADTGVNDL